MLVVTIRADVNLAKETVVLTTDQNGLVHPVTFSVKHGETVQWNVFGDLGGLVPQVKITTFAKGSAGTGQPRRLFKEGTENTLPATADVVVGTVDLMAHEGNYLYDVELVGGPRLIRLSCLWPTVPGQPALPNMGGGVKTDPPPEP